MTKGQREALAQASRRQMGLATPPKVRGSKRTKKKRKHRGPRPKHGNRPINHPQLMPEHATERVEICPVGMAVIYALVDPRDGTVRYIGKSIRPGDRLDQHVSHPHNNAGLRRWVLRLKDRREAPELHAIDLVMLADWPEAERKWIAFYRERGVIFNIEDGGPSRSRTSQRQPHASARNAGTNQADSSKPRAADFECMEPADGGPKHLPETARDDVQRFAVASHAPINLRGASAEARDWSRGTNAEPHSTQNGADPTRDHVEPTAGIAEGPHVRIAGVTSESALSRGAVCGETAGADPST